MRFFELSALAASIAFQGASAQQAYGPPAEYGSSLTSATTTYYTTMTVLRVETTVTATRNGTTSTYESLVTSALVQPTVASASATIPVYGNGTSSILGTGALPSTTGYVPPASPGAAGKLGIEAIGVAALAGVIGLLV